MAQQSNQLLKSKIKIPKGCKNALDRVGLKKKMSETDASILMLHGRAGYGKTETARQFCLIYPHRAAWYTLDVSDNDPKRFLIYLNSALAGILKGYISADETRDSQNIQDRNAYFSGIIYKTCAALEQEECEYLLVLDCLETIYNEEISELLRELADNLPEKLRLCLATSGKVPDFLSRFVMSGTCMVLEETDLAFTGEEQRALACQLLSCGEKERETVILQAEGVLEGWPAALMLALLFIERKKMEGGIIDWSYLMQESLINSFLSSEIFRKLPTQERDFLIKTSELVELKDDICDQILQIKHSHAMIHSLLEKSILFFRVEQGVSRICHREVIRLFLKEQADKGTQTEIARKTADYYMEVKDYARAARQAVKSGCTLLIMRIIEYYGNQMLLTENDTVLELCIRYLEESGGVVGINAGAGRGLPPNPEILGIAAQYYYKKGMTETMEACLNQADSLFGKENKFGMYRGLYKGLLKYREYPSRYEKQIYNTLFLLEENRYPLPYLRKGAADILRQLKEKRERETPDKLKISFFGDFQAMVIKEQKTLSWRTRKGCELFAYMVKLDGRAVSRKQLLKTLWNDEIPDNAVTMLHNILYNIRKELSAYHMEDLIQYKDKMYCIHMERIETDMENIRYLCDLVDKKDRKNLEQNREAFKLYWGRYLEEVDSLWAMEEREYYDTCFFKGCVLLACAASDDGRFEDAARFFKNAMTINSYCEELEMELLKCYGAMHNLKQVKAEYERFSSLLEEDLQTEPGKELAAFYKTILNP